MHLSIAFTLRARRSLTLLVATLSTALGGCSQGAPAAVSDCNAFVESTGIRYEFLITNKSTDTVDAVRVNYLSPESAAEGVQFSKTRPVTVWDFENRLGPHSSKQVGFQTHGLPRTKSPLHSGPIQCEVLSLRYADGTTWSIAPGIVAPGGVWHPKRADSHSRSSAD